EYHNFTPLAGDPEIVNLITQGESATLEFKSTARWDLREKKKSKVMEQIIVKTVTAFLNSQGGTLLIGVEDDGNVIGLEADYQTLKKGNKQDAYELFLTDLLLEKEIGKDSAPYIRISFGEVEKKDVCQITVKPSPRPVYIQVKNKNGEQEESLFIRINNSTRKLDKPSEIRNYCQDRWAK
ncbi:MAG: ATP-binding protein, partial [Spirulinaceae cyanobacterium]